MSIQAPAPTKTRHPHKHTYLSIPCDINTVGLLAMREEWPNNPNTVAERGAATRVADFSSNDQRGADLQTLRQDLGDEARIGFRRLDPVGAFAQRTSSLPSMPPGSRSALGPRLASRRLVAPNLLGEHQGDEDRRIITSTIDDRYMYITYCHVLYCVLL
jgi:hypothetical protein